MSVVPSLSTVKIITEEEDHDITWEFLYTICGRTIALQFQKLGRRSPSEYSLEIEDRCMFGNVLSWHPLKLTICWLVLLMLLTISYSSKEPDVEVYGMRRAFSEGDMLKVSLN
ncbi:hypothetical protein F2P56_023407 [Juglans regia]|uniref:Uncharacterized protein n=1 Tax=Juglans regia TaxID=51240 RepID=A0A833UW43_JUGRE|nr:hypothetical protein F2P56_023407 [Juglans regia]